MPDLLEPVKRHRMKNGHVPTGNQVETWFGVLNRFLQDREVTTDFMETLLGIEIVSKDSARLQEGGEEWLGRDGGDDGDGDEWSAGGGDGRDGGDGGDGGD